MRRPVPPPVVLCYFEGKTHEEAARQLGWPLGTVKGRLARARDLLRDRLARRGLAVSAVALGAALAHGATQAAVPPALLGLTLRAALSFAASGAISGAAASAQAVTLAKGALQTMAVSKLVHVIALMLAVGVIAFGAALGAGLGGQGEKEDNAVAESKALRVNQDEAVPPTRARKDGAQAIQLTLASTRKEYRVGEPVDLILTIKNNGREEFSYLKDKLRELNGFEMTGPDGKEVKPALNPVEFGGPATFLTVKPGEAVTVKDVLKHINLSINLSKVPGTKRYLRHMYYPMEAAGTYRLRMRVGDVTSNELKIKVLEKDREVEKDGVRFEILVPNRTWPIPQDKPRITTPVKLGLRITNNTAKALRFSGFAALVPEMVDSDGKALQRSSGSDGTYARKQSDCPLAKPGESVTFSTDGMLTWRNGRLGFGVEGAAWGGFWQFDDLKPGHYRLRLRYANLADEFTLSMGQPPKVLKDVWKGAITTPFVEVTLVPAQDRKPDDAVKLIADPAELARMKKYYPHGFNFVDAIRFDGKIVWASKLVRGDKVEAKQWEFATVDEFQRALLKEKIAKETSFEVHLPAVNPAVPWAAPAAARAQQILDYLREKGYKKAGAVSN